MQQNIELGKGILYAVSPSSTSRWSWYPLEDGKIEVMYIQYFSCFDMSYFSFIPTIICRVDVNSISSFCLDKFVRRLARYRVYVCSTLSLNATKYRAWEKYFVCCQFQFDVKMELVSTGGWENWGYVYSVLFLFWHMTYFSFFVLIKNQNNFLFYLLWRWNCNPEISDSWYNHAWFSTSTGNCFLPTSDSWSAFRATRLAHPNARIAA